MRLDPGIIELLEVELGGSAIGTGYRPRHNVPFGVAATAAYALVVPYAEGRSWTGRDVEVEWLAEADPQDILLAEAELTAIDPGLACFTFRAYTQTGRSLLNGKLRLSALREGTVIPTALLPPRRPDGPGPELEAGRLLAAVAAPATLGLGRTAEVRVTVANTSASRRDVVVTAQRPFGAGLSLDSDESVSRGLEPGATSVVVFRIRADRPDEVNLSRPWPLLLTARTETETDSRIVPIAVPDSEPGRVFYVLTEDCETFDGGPLTGDYGSLAALGNGNNFMDPEEYRIQMIAKPARLNEIADRHGARWTHFWCAPQRFAVDWAMRQSNSGAWEALAQELDESVRQGAVRHEYAPHLHFDYEPDSQLPPQPRLVYDAATDGILPNDYYHPVTNPRHHWHDWDGSGRGISYIKNLGDLRHLDSKAGSLYKTQRFLARLSAHRRYALVARTGGCDFGITSQDQEVSTQAFEANGLRGNSDARAGGGRPPRGNQMYWCDAGDRLREIGELSAARLVQLCIALETDCADADAINRWFASAWEEAGGPGVRVLMTMTHAMFVRGEPDPFRSLTGGGFAALDQHLAWVRERYPRVHFATASEALVEYLDYYTPSLEAFVEPGLCGGDPAAGRYEYAVRLLGNGIRVDARHPATVRVLSPPWFDAGDLARLRVVADGSVVTERDQFDAAARPAVEFTLSTRPAALRLEVEVRPEAVAALAAGLPASLPFIDPPEPRRGPLFQLGRPYSGDLLRLLMNPMGGHAEPLGRRIHPLGVYAMGLALTAALPAQAGGPCRLWLRWRKSIAMEATLSTTTEPAGDHSVRVRILDDAGDTIADSQVWPAEEPSPAVVSGKPDDAGDRFAAALDETLHVYRAQRAWRVMLWVRKGYAVATRQGLPAFLRWLPAALAGRGDIDSEELSFPRWDQFRRPR